MQKVLSQNELTEEKNVFVYVERKQSDGKIRHGLVGKIDLECYDYSQDSQSPIRATEKTVLERIPPRMKVREYAPIEYPHVMLLLNDREKTIIEPLKEKNLKKLYDFDLMLDGGHITGYLVNGKEAQQIESLLETLVQKENLTFAVGDGNHSLAAAKMHYEKLKREQHIDIHTHKARYALVELVNLYDDAIEFSPIYRVLFHANMEDFIKELEKYCDEGDGEQSFILVHNGEKRYHFKKKVHPLVVGTIQEFLDTYLAKHPECQLDYIHDEEAVKNICKTNHAIGFLYKSLQKEDLFPTIVKDGVLPRKTFSIGNARDKRYYLEGRKIQ